MTYRIRLTPSAVDDLQALPKKIQRRIARKIDVLANNPRPPQSKKLKGQPDLFRLRSGDYRIIYQIKDDILLVLVIRIRHRKDVYRQLENK